MVRILIAALLCVSLASPAFGADGAAAPEQYSKTPPKKTLVIMGVLVGAGAAMIVAGHTRYPDRPDNNPLTWGGVGLAGGTALLFGLHYAFKHPPGAGESKVRAAGARSTALVPQSLPRGNSTDHE